MSRPVPFPFSAIVGQEEMKLALLIAAVDQSVGGVLVFGDRGTGKSTAVRALATAYVLGISCVDANALSSWWEEDGAGFKALSEGGVITGQQ